MKYYLKNTFVLTALDMGRERGAKQLMVCKKNDRGVEVKKDWDKRELVTALQGSSSDLYRDQFFRRFLNLSSLVFIYTMILILVYMISEEDAMALKWVPPNAQPR